MVKDAELQAAADKAKSEEAEVRNNASSLIYSTEKSLKEVGEKLDAGARGEVEHALGELKRVSENGTVAEIKPAIEKLQTGQLQDGRAALQSRNAATAKRSAARRRRGRGLRNGASAGTRAVRRRHRRRVQRSQVATARRDRDSERVGHSPRAPAARAIREFLLLELM